jgi:lipoate-protein ligase A
MPETAHSRKTLVIADPAPRSPWMNMAVDEILSNSREVAASHSSCAFIRFYSWDRKCVSFGYAQPHQRVASGNPGLPSVRRPTGGGTVPHGEDLTYSIVLFPGSVIFGMGRNDLYLCFHKALMQAFLHIGIQCGIRAEKSTNSGYYRCFEKPVQGDLLLSDGRKIAGAAQKHGRDSIMMQGSVCTGLVSVPQDRFRELFVKSIAEIAGLSMEKFKIPERAEKDAVELAVRKYATDSWNVERKA